MHHQYLLRRPPGPLSGRVAWQAKGAAKASLTIEGKGPTLSAEFFPPPQFCTCFEPAQATTRYNYNYNYWCQAEARAACSSWPGLATQVDATLSALYRDEEVAGIRV